MRSARLPLAILAVLYMLAAPLGGMAQEREESIVSTDQLTRALSQRAQEEARNRDRIIGVLERSEVQQVADGLGIDLRDAKAAVHTLNGDDLATVAANADSIDQALAGGQGTITISVVAALLIVIIIILIT